MDANETQDSGDTDRLIVEELQRLLESPFFVRSPVLSRLLQFLVEHRLRGGRSTPKAYAIATEALGRSADFDPAIDSYPRVMVGRLRTLLDRYYSETPWEHRLRVPQGSYEIVVQHQTLLPGGEGDQAAGASADTAFGPNAAGAVTSSQGADNSTARRLGGWAISIFVFVAALLIGWQMLGGAGRLFVAKPVAMPVVEVSPPQAGDSADSRAVARALDGKLRDGLQRFGLVELLSAKPQNGLGDSVDYRLDSSIVRSDDGTVDVTLVLNRIANHRTIWSQQYRVARDDVLTLGTIEPGIAQIGGDYGLIVRDQIRRQPTSFAPGFPCVAQFNRLRQTRGIETTRQVEACLRGMLAQDPLDPVVLSSLSLMRFSEWQMKRGTPAGQAAFADAQHMALQAYQNGSTSATGLFAMARANFYAGNCAAGNAMGNAAVRANPYDPDIYGFLGLFKAGCGQMEESEALLQRSLELDASFPGVPAVTLAFLLSQRGDQDAAIAVLDNMPAPTNAEPQSKMVRAIVTARRGDQIGGRRLWEELLAFTNAPADAPPEAVLRQFLVAPTVIERAAAALRDSGIVQGQAAP